MPLAWLVATAVLFESSAMYLVVPLASQLTERLDLSEDSLWLLQASHIFGTLAASLVTPWLARRCGARLTFVGAMFAFGVALVLWPVADGFLTFTALRFCAGTAGGVVWIAGVVWLGEAGLPDELGRNSGFVMAYTLLGTALGPVLGSIALSRGLAPVCTLLAAVSAIAALGAARRPDPPRQFLLEEGVGSPLARWKSFGLVAVPLLVTCLAAGARFSVLPLDLETAGLTPSNVGLAFGAAGVLMAAIAIPVGHGVDRFGEREVLAWSLLGLSMVAGILAAPVSLNVLVVAGLLFAAGLQAAWTPLLAMASRESERHGLSPRIGIAALNVMWTVGVLGGTAMLTGVGSDTSVLWLAVGLLCAASMAALPFLRIDQARPSEQRAVGNEVRGGVRTQHRDLDQRHELGQPQEDPGDRRNR